MLNDGKKKLSLSGRFYFTAIIPKYRTLVVLHSILSIYTAFRGRVDFGAFCGVQLFSVHSRPLCRESSDKTLPISLVPGTCKPGGCASISP